MWSRRQRKNGKYFDGFGDVMGGSELVMSRAAGRWQIRYFLKLKIDCCEVRWIYDGLVAVLSAVMGGEVIGGVVWAASSSEVRPKWGIRFY